MSSMPPRSEKPLPEVPAKSLNSTLSLDARAHRRRLILHALEEERIPDNDSHSREAWANGIEKALDDLGTNIMRGGWLAGFKRARYIRKERRDAEGIRRAQVIARLQKEKEEDEKARNKTRSSLKSGSKLRDEVVANDVDEEQTTSEGTHRVALEQLRQLISTPFSPQPKPSVKHLLLTVVEFGSHTVLPAEDEGFDIVRPAINCSFTANVFTLPNAESSSVGDAVLYGLNEWDNAPGDDRIQVVGGTFRLQGSPSPAHHTSLCKVLRTAVYVHLSLLLEQSFLSDSHIELHFPKPTLLPLPQVGRAVSSPNVKRKSKRESVSVLWSFLSKKTEDLLHRASNVGPALARHGSLDLPLVHKMPRHTSLPQSPQDAAMGRPRRLSFILSTASSRITQNNEARSRPFSFAVQQIRASQKLFSTSPGLAFTPPSLLLDLAEKEIRDPARKLTGDEKAALKSILGWESNAMDVKGMTGLAGFVRHQGFSALYSEHVPSTTPVSSAQSSVSSAASASLLVPPRVTCSGHRRKWVNYRYYERGDESLGEAIVRMCESTDQPCDKPGCQFKRVEHDMRWMHDGVRVTATVVLPTYPCVDEEAIQMWQSCAICGAESLKEDMHDGTHLLSFAKYLELLVYSPGIHTLVPALCLHTKVTSPMEVSKARFDILRRFAYKGRTVTFVLSPIEDVFELRVPRLQITRRRIGDKKSEAPTEERPKRNSSTDDDRKNLRREIMRWWQGLSEHIDKLEDNFNNSHPESYHKTLPRLPSPDDAYDIHDEDPLATPKGYLPPNTPQTLTASDHDSNPFGTGPFPSPVPVSSHAGTSADSVTSDGSSSRTLPADSVHLLTGLRHTFQQTEQSLYAELSQTPVTSLNDVRRSFQTAARGATRRMLAWEVKHASQMPKGSVIMGTPSVEEPEWWRNGCHAVPGGNVIVRENDWGSIIAFTLSSLDYQRELSNMATARHGSPSSSPTPPVVTRPSFFSPGASIKRFMSGAEPSPDPDQEGIVWQEPETYSAVISRKDHPRDPTALMSIRGVLRPKASAESMGPTPPPKFATIGPSSGRAIAHDAPPSARTKPAVEVSMQAADGEVSGTADAVESAGKILHELGTVSRPGSPRHTSIPEHVSLPSTGPVETNIRRQKAPSIVPADSDTSTVGVNRGSGTATPPPPPPKDSTDTPTNSVESRLQTPESTPTSRPNSPSTLAATLTSSITAAMRYVLKPGDIERPPSPKPHHGLLSLESPAIDERPHIKYEWTIGTRLKFSCTVYYAKQFDALRRRCGIEDVFLKSLARSENWAAEGGKSRSNFWKTTDNRFIIKTLVNAWNVADLQVLIDLGPSYFRYMDATANKPTVLAKLLGFYTVEIRNLESGATQAKADLLIMENLFYDQKIAKTFDLKGIQGRKVKAAASSGSSKTLFDGEWIEGQQTTLTLVRPHSKVVLQEAIKADCDFLARSNIMDYSLLLGIDEERKQIACGLVDTIGSYTFAKTLEYKAKQGLHSGKEVTVVPPLEYQERFMTAMDNYFLACPDKWSRPLDNTVVPSDCRQLPSVL